MKKAFGILLICIVLTAGTAYAESIPIDAIQAEINLGESWFIITQDTAEIDMSSSNLTWLRSLILRQHLEEIKTWLQQEDNAHIHAAILYFDGTNLIQAFIYTEENELTHNLWDASLFSEEELDFQWEKIVDRYTTSNGDFYLSSQLNETNDESADDDLAYSYMTLNNGRNIYIFIESQEVAGQEAFLYLCHELLEGISYTKAPKPAVTVTGSEDPLTFYQKVLAQYDGEGQKEFMEATGNFIGLIVILVFGLAYRERRDARKAKNGDYVLDEAFIPQAYYGMKWHKFLIYFVLWANAVMAIGQAFLLFTGHFHGIGSDIKNFYFMFPMLKLTDYAYAVWHLIFAFLIFIARFQLADLRSKGPAILNWSFAFNSIMAHVYERAILANWRSNEEMYGLFIENELLSFSFTGLSAYIPVILFIMVNYIYYKNRRELFS